MGLQLGLFLTQGMKQELRMTPQLQQAIRLLVLSRAELIEELQQELSSNPLLEEGTEGSDRGDDREERVSDSYEGEEGAELGPAENSASDDLSAVEWEHYIDELPTSSDDMPYQHSDELPSIDVTYSRRESLSEHLTWQLEVSQLGEQISLVARHLITYLNDHGYLSAPPLEEVAARCAPKISEPGISACPRVLHRWPGT